MSRRNPYSDPTSEAAFESHLSTVTKLGLGILVLILALGVFLPIWDLGQAALKK